MSETLLVHTFLCKEGFALSQLCRLHNCAKLCRLHNYAGCTTVQNLHNCAKLCSLHNCAQLQRFIVWVQFGDLGYSNKIIFTEKYINFSDIVHFLSVGIISCTGLLALTHWIYCEGVRVQLSYSPIEQVHTQH